MVQAILLTKLNSYKRTIKENEELLTDPKIGYHEYFAIVYRLEQQRILKEQL